jgi:hypothetical protein
MNCLRPVGDTAQAVSVIVAAIMQAIRVLNVLHNTLYLFTQNIHQNNLESINRYNLKYLRVDNEARNALRFFTRLIAYLRRCAVSHSVLHGVQIGGSVTSLYSQSDTAALLALMRQVDNTSSPPII